MVRPTAMRITPPAMAIATEVCTARLTWLASPGAEKLGDDDGGAGGQAHKKAYQQVDEGGGGAAYRCQGLFAGDVAHDDGIGGVVQLLKKGSQQNGKKKSRSCFQITPWVMLFSWLVVCMAAPHYKYKKAESVRPSR